MITLDVHDTIPIIDGKRYVASQMPAVDGTLAGYRRLRDALDERVQALVGEIASLSQRPRRAYGDQHAAVEARVLGIGRSARQMLVDAGRAVATMDGELAARVIEVDDGVDAAYLDIERAIVEVVAQQ